MQFKVVFPTPVGYLSSMMKLIHSSLEAGGGGEEDGEGEEGGAASPNRHGRPARVGSETDWRRKGEGSCGLSRGGDEWWRPVQIGRAHV